MIIKQFEVIGLPGHSRPLSRTLHADLNIFTGRNGSGKTNLLKLLWYFISGNIEHAVNEVPFTRATVETSEYTISVSKSSDKRTRIEIRNSKNHNVFESPSDDDDFPFYDPVEQANEVTKDIGSSVFFPTFRRIEGGFSLNSIRQNRGPLQGASRGRNEIEDALVLLSRRMSVGKHTFVSSLSTSDIVSLLMRNYTELSEISNTFQKETSQIIIDRIKSYKRHVFNESLTGVPADDTAAEDVLDEVRLFIEKAEAHREGIMAPLDAVRKLVEKLFQHSGIRLSTRLSFGDAANAISSDALSAGEKQMLSFISYNAFNNNSIFFIDEPELSLHVDWQRQLFPTLQSQETSNQFLIATHSPFIYSKYPENEILIGADRGAETVDVD